MADLPQRRLHTSRRFVHWPCRRCGHAGVRLGQDGPWGSPHYCHRLPLRWVLSWHLLDAHRFFKRSLGSSGVQVIVPGRAPGAADRPAAPASTAWAVVTKRDPGRRRAPPSPRARGPPRCAGPAAHRLARAAARGSSARPPGDRRDPARRGRTAASGGEGGSPRRDKREAQAPCGRRQWNRASPPAQLELAQDANLDPHAMHVTRPRTQNPDGANGGPPGTRATHRPVNPHIPRGLAGGSRCRPRR